MKLRNPSPRRGGGRPAETRARERPASSTAASSANSLAPFAFQHTLAKLGKGTQQNATPQGAFAQAPPPEAFRPNWSRTDGSHRLAVCKRFLFCRACGLYAARVLRELAKPCEGRPGCRNYARILAGFEEGRPPAARRTPVKTASTAVSSGVPGCSLRPPVAACNVETRK